VISAGSASGYLAGEVHLPFSATLLTVFILLLFAAICFLGIHESSRFGLIILIIHLATMFVIAIAAVVRLGIYGNSLLVANWHAAQPSSLAEALKQIFLGASIVFIGNTGKLSYQTNY